MQGAWLVRVEKTTDQAGCRERWSRRHGCNQGSKNVCPCLLDVGDQTDQGEGICVSSDLADPASLYLRRTHRSAPLIRLGLDPSEVLCCYQHVLNDQVPSMKDGSKRKDMGIVRYDNQIVEIDFRPPHANCVTSRIIMSHLVILDTPKYTCTL